MEAARSAIVTTESPLASVHVRSANRQPPLALASVTT
jgi:hypothetical protein